MLCTFCGEGDKWIKTCRTPDGLICVCDPCWEAITPWLVIVLGDGDVTARCDLCEGQASGPRAPSRRRAALHRRVRRRARLSSNCCGEPARTGRPTPLWPGARRRCCRDAHAQVANC